MVQRLAIGRGKNSHAMAPAAHCKSRAKAEQRFVAQCERARARRAHSETNKYVADDRSRALPPTLIDKKLGVLMRRVAIQPGYSRSRVRTGPQPPRQSSHSRRHDDGTHVLLPEELSAAH